jgi:hypothetical protein
MSLKKNETFTVEKRDCKSAQNEDTMYSHVDEVAAEDVERSYRYQ